MLSDPPHADHPNRDDPDDHNNNTEPAAQPLTHPVPSTPAQLLAFIRTHLHIHPGTHPLIDGHTAPFAFLVHTFFEGVDFSAAVQNTNTTPASGARWAVDSVVWANRGGGKTFLAALAALLDMHFKPGITLALLGGSLQQARRLFQHLADLTERLGYQRARSAAPPADARFTLHSLALPNGSLAHVLAASHTAVRGVRVQKVYCDEVDLFKPELWDAAQLTTRSLPLRGPWGERVRPAIHALSTMQNPFGLMHDLISTAHTTDHQRTAGTQPAQPSTPPAPPAPPSHPLPILQPSPAPDPAAPFTARTLFKWGVLDVAGVCPAHVPCETCVVVTWCQGRLKHRPPDHTGHVLAEDLPLMRTRVPLSTWEAEMLCLRTSRSLSVYPAFDPAVHVSADADLAPSHVRIIAGMDSGFAGLTVILWAWTDGWNVRITHEYAHNGTTDEHYVQVLASGAFPTPSTVYIDRACSQHTVAAPGSTVERMQQRLGIPFVFPEDDQFAILRGIDRVRLLMESASASPGPQSGAPQLPPRLLIHPRCPRLISALGRYRFRSLTSQTPVKDGPDHFADALRYMVVCLKFVDPATAHRRISVQYL